MKDTIYTIPITESYETPCECPLCVLEKRFEQDRVNYYMGPSLMEPDNRIKTNDRGFCGRHFKLMYDTKTNRLGLGLVIDTYLDEQIARLKKASDKRGVPAVNMTEYWRKHEGGCVICEDLSNTMDRCIENLLDLYSSEQDFRAKFDSGLGYCMKHFTILSDKASKRMFGSRKEQFLKSLSDMQIAALERMKDEVDWFTKKFDYRYRDADWGNSRDSIPRTIAKLTSEVVSDN